MVRNLKAPAWIGWWRDSRVRDIVLDTCVLVDVLADCLSSASRIPCFGQSGRVSGRLAEDLNRVVRYHTSGDYHDGGVIAVSAFAFVELARNWHRFESATFTEERLYYFLHNLPEWLSIDPVDESIIPYVRSLPTEVWEGPKRLPLELPDVIHAATCLSRGDAVLATQDCRIGRIPVMQGRLLQC